MTLKLADLIQRKADLVWGQGIVELADNGRGGWDAWIRVGADIPKAWQHGIIDYQFAVTPTCTAEDGFRFETSKPTVRTHVPDTWIGSIPWLGKEIEDVGRAILQAEAEARAEKLKDFPSVDLAFCPDFWMGSHDNLELDWSAALEDAADDGLHPLVRAFVGPEHLHAVEHNFGCRFDLPNVREALKETFSP